jgi:glycosyltransferase involved in cell wall biosynthesis
VLYIDQLGIKKIAILIPCKDEALTIKKVVEDFQEILPNAAIYVYDNNSTDDTARIALEAGAIVRAEKRQGKGFVVESMFRDIDADIYVMVDGDDTYPASKVKSLIDPILVGKADMVVGNRLVEFGDRSFRSFHQFGNRLVASLVNGIFNAKLNDIMSGYRAFNRSMAKEVPIVSKGFEIETEITIQALFRNFIVKEVPITYGARPEGSHSKLSTFRDGMRVLVKIVDIFKAYRPLVFFGVIAAVLTVIGLGFGSIPIVGFLETGKVERFPTAILATGIMVLSFLAAACGIILDSINHRLTEMSQLIVKSNADIKGKTQCDLKSNP